MTGAVRGARGARMIVSAAVALAVLTVPAMAQQQRRGVMHDAAPSPEPDYRRLSLPVQPSHSLPPSLPPSLPATVGRALRTGYLVEPVPSPMVQPRRLVQQSSPVVVYYVPYPYAYPYAYPYPDANRSYEQGRMSSAVDVNGRPLHDGADDAVPLALPGVDLSGSEYLVLSDGSMSVDFGYGDRRTFPSCALLDAARSPDGRPRTIFYAPQADGLVLRFGQRGRVSGSPPAGASVCYAADRYGRVVLSY